MYKRMLTLFLVVTMLLLAGCSDKSNNESGDISDITKTEKSLETNNISVPKMIMLQCGEKNYSLDLLWDSNKCNIKSDIPCGGAVSNGKVIQNDMFFAFDIEYNNQTSTISFSVVRKNSISGKSEVDCTLSMHRDESGHYDLFELKEKENTYKFNVKYPDESTIVVYQEQELLFTINYDKNNKSITILNANGKTVDSIDLVLQKEYNDEGMITSAMISDLELGISLIEYEKCDINIEDCNETIEILPSFVAVMFRYECLTFQDVIIFILRQSYFGF